jgi:hypothetical protein
MILGTYITRRMKRISHVAVQPPLRRPPPRPTSPPLALVGIPSADTLCSVVRGSTEGNGCSGAGPAGARCNERFVCGKVLGSSTSDDSNLRFGTLRAGPEPGASSIIEAPAKSFLGKFFSCSLSEYSSSISRAPDVWGWDRYAFCAAESLDDGPIKPECPCCCWCRLSCSNNFGSIVCWTVPLAGSGLPRISPGASNQLPGLRLPS